MNKLLSKLFLVAIVALIVPVFISCDDDKKPNDEDYAKLITGQYTGNMTGKVMGQLDIEEISGVKIVVDYVSKNNATLTIDQTITTPMVVIPLKVTCPVTTSGEGDKTKITGTVKVKFEEPISIGAASLSELEVKIDGTINASGVAVINIKDKSTNGTLVTVTFNGSRPVSEK